MSELGKPIETLSENQKDTPSTRFNRKNVSLPDASIVVSITALCFALLGLLLDLWYHEVLRNQALLASSLLLLFSAFLALLGIVVSIFQRANPAVRKRRWIALALLPFCVLIIRFLPYTERPGRAQVSKAKTDMRTIATGLEAYFVDAGIYPQTLTQLTTPTAYLSSLPIDSMLPKSLKPFQYCPKENGWILWSTGPDGHYDLTRQNILNLYDPRTTQPRTALEPFAYDSTNGALSRGDIWRIHQ